MTVPEVEIIEQLAIELLKKHDTAPWLKWVTPVETQMDIGRLSLSVSLWFRARGLVGGFGMNGDWPAIYIEPGMVSERAQAFRAFP